MDDAGLLVATAHGDADAFASFYRRHLRQVVGFCLRATGDPDVAADLTAEVFAAAIEAAGRYQPSRDSALPWLLGIARNKLLESRRRGRVEDRLRRRLRMAPLELGDDDLRRVGELAALDEIAVAAAVDGLPAAERDAVRARVIDERSYREIAATLECSESVVRQRVSRGLARVRDRLTAGPKETNG